MIPEIFRTVKFFHWNGSTFSPKWGGAAAGRGTDRAIHVKHGLSLTLSVSRTTFGRVSPCWVRPRMSVSQNRAFSWTAPSLTGSPYSFHC